MFTCLYRFIFAYRFTRCYFLCGLHEVYSHIMLRPNLFSINLLVVYRESVNLIGYITRRLSADSQQL